MMSLRSGTARPDDRNSSISAEIRPTEVEVLQSKFYCRGYDVQRQLMPTTSSKLRAVTPAQLPPVCPEHHAVAGAFLQQACGIPAGLLQGHGAGHHAKSRRNAHFIQCFITVPKRPRQSDDRCPLLLCVARYARWCFTE